MRRTSSGWIFFVQTRPYPLTIDGDTDVDDKVDSTISGDANTNGIGATIAGLHHPALIVQEGGYPCPELGDNLKSYLSGFLGVHWSG